MKKNKKLIGKCSVCGMSPLGLNIQGRCRWCRSDIAKKAAATRLERKLAASIAHGQARAENRRNIAAGKAILEAVTGKTWEPVGVWTEPAPDVLQPAPGVIFDPVICEYVCLDAGGLAAENGVEVAP